MKCFRFHTYILRPYRSVGLFETRDGPKLSRSNEIFRLVSVQNSPAAISSRFDSVGFSTGHISFRFVSIEVFRTMISSRSVSVQYLVDPISFRLVSVQFFKDAISFSFRLERFSRVANFVSSRLGRFFWVSNFVSFRPRWISCFVSVEFRVSSPLKPTFWPKYMSKFVSNSQFFELTFLFAFAGLSLINWLHIFSFDRFFVVVSVNIVQFPKRNDSFRLG